MTNSYPHKRSNDKPITIRDLYPHLSEEQLKEAEENLNRYIEMALQIYERIDSDPKGRKWLDRLAQKRQKQKSSKSP